MLGASGEVGECGGEVRGLSGSKEQAPIHGLDLRPVWRPEHSLHEHLPNTPGPWQRGPCWAPHVAIWVPRDRQTTSVSQDVCLFSLCHSRSTPWGQICVCEKSAAQWGPQSHGVYPWDPLGPPGPTPHLSRTHRTLQWEGQASDLSPSCVLHGSSWRPRPAGGLGPGESWGSPTYRVGPASSLTPPLSPGAPERKAGLCVIRTLIS